MRAETTFAKAEHGLLKANLFRPIPRAGCTDLHQSTGPTIQEEFVFNKRRLSVNSPFVLGANDLSLLLAILALAGRDGEIITACATSTQGRDYIIRNLESTGDFADAPHMMITTLRSILCRETGLKINGAAYKRIDKSLERLGAVTYADLGSSDEDSRMGHSDRCGQRLLWSQLDPISKKTTVVLNARFTMGMSRGFARIDLDESRGLGEMPRLLHFRWSWTVREGNSGKMKTDDLCKLIYGNASRLKKLRGRREEVRRGMKALGQLPGWTVVEIASVMFMVTRPPRDRSRGARHTPDA